MGILSEAFQSARRLRRIVLFVALLYAGSFVVGWYLIAVKSPVAIETAKAITGSVLTETPFTTILQSLRGGDLIQAVLMTFLVNLAVGAFSTTTLPGILPLVGVLGPVGVALLRGFVIGVTYPDVLTSSPIGFALGLGTLVLELGAYVFSSAAGINIALAPVLPTRYHVKSRWAAFKMGWKDAARIYVIIVILLALGAIWEMTGLYLVLRGA